MSYWSSLKKTLKHIRIIPKWKGFEFKFEWKFIVPWLTLFNFLSDGIFNEHWEITFFTWHF